MQEKLLSAGGLSYFPQGNPGKLLCIYLCSACTVKSSVFCTPRALLSFLKCYSAHRAQPDAWYTGVSAPSVHSMWTLARGLWGLRTDPLPQVSPQMPWKPQWLSQEAFSTFLDGKKKVLLGQWRWWLLGMLEDITAKSSPSDTCLQRMLKSVCELCFLNLWFSVIYEPIALQPVWECYWTTKSY